VADKPKELIPASAGRPVAGHGAGEIAAASGAFSRASSRCGVLIRNVAGMRPWCNASAVFASPASPAAASTWPMFDFTEPIRHGRSLPAAPNTSSSAVSSTSSPTGVPAPCAST